MTRDALDGIDHRLLAECLLHDLGNRLTGLSLALDTLVADRSVMSPQARSVLACAHESADHLQSLVDSTRQLLKWLRVGSGLVPTPTDVSQLLTEGIGVAGDAAPAVDLTRTAGAPGPDTLVMADAPVIAAALAVALRALRAPVIVDLQRDDRLVRIRLSSSGQAAPASHTLDYLCTHIAEAHAGWFERAVDGERTTVTLSIPLARPAQA